MGIEAGVMTVFILNARVTVLTGEGVDEFGDPTDGVTLAQVPCCDHGGHRLDGCHHGFQRRFRPAEGRTTVVEEYGSGSARTRRSTRGSARDELGRIYLVQNVHAIRGRDGRRAGHGNASGWRVSARERLTALLGTTSKATEREGRWADGPLG
ncbi:hypothetical protein HBB16_04485 [Pseudonocardia sp. MCCB 268]|nr:hypothetical protein [Pseudonocardia cytotoxica]